jgi:hypothetical protein
MGPPIAGDMGAGDMPGDMGAGDMAGDMGAGVIVAGDPADPVGGLLGHGKFCAAAWNAGKAANARTRGRQLALMVRDSPSSSDTPTVMSTIR